MAKRKKYETKITNSDFKIKIGSLDEGKLTTLYFECGTFIIPNDIDADYIEIFNEMETSFKSLLKKELMNNLYFSNDMISVFDIASDRMKVGKRSYLSIQCYLKLNNTMEFNEAVNKLLPNINNILNFIEDNLAINNLGHTKYKKIA